MRPPAGACQHDVGVDENRLRDKRIDRQRRAVVLAQWSELVGRRHPHVALGKLWIGRLGIVKHGVDGCFGKSPAHREHDLFRTAELGQVVVRDRDSRPVNAVIFTLCLHADNPLERLRWPICGRIAGYLFAPAALYRTANSSQSQATGRFRARALTFARSYGRSGRGATGVGHGKRPELPRHRDSTSKDLAEHCGNPSHNGAVRCSECRRVTRDQADARLLPLSGPFPLNSRTGDDRRSEAARRADDGRAALFARYSVASRQTTNRKWAHGERHRRFGDDSQGPS